MMAVFVAIRTWLWVRNKHKQQRLEFINSQLPDIQAAFNDIIKHFNYNHYLTESEWVKIETKYSDLEKQVQKLIGSKELKESGLEEFICN